MRRYAFAAILFAMVAGCGSSQDGVDNGTSTDVLITYDTNQPDGQVGNDVQAGDTNVRDNVVADDTITGDVGEITRVIELNVDASAPIPLAMDQQFTFRAQVFDTEDNPVANPAVSFTITYVETTDTAEEVLEYDGSMLRPSAVGDSEGKVSSTFQAGQDLYIYTITVSTKGAESKAFQIQVAELDCACSNVSLTYDGVPGDGAAYNILAFDSSVTCDQVMDTGDLPQAVAEITVGTIEEPAVIPCLTPGATYTVLVTGSETCAFAKGCAEGVTVGAANDAENCGAGTVSLDGIDVSIGNVFTEGKNKLTFTNVVPTCSFSASMNCDNLASMSFGDQSCCYLNAVQQLFADDGSAFAGAVADAAGVEGTVYNTVVSAVETWVGANTPAWVARAATMGSYVRNVMAQTNLESIITINAPDGEGNFTGKTDWRRYVLFWKMDCDPTDPEYYACGKLFIAMSAMGGISYAPDLDDSSFTGSLGLANNFTINSHSINMNPGRLLVYTVNKIAARTLTGGYINEDNELITVNAAADLKEAYGRWMNCEQMVADLASSAPAVTSAVCSAAIDAAMAEVTAGADAILVDSHIELSATGSYTDASCDGIADELSSGVYSGNWVRGAETVEMSGNFSGIAD